MTRREKAVGKSAENVSSSPQTFQTATRLAGLEAYYRPGKGAIEGRHRDAIRNGDPRRFVGSLDMDAACRANEPNAPRWDYGLGMRMPSARREIAVWIESHPASSTREVDVMLRKLRWLKTKLDSQHHLRALTVAASDARVPPFRWLASDGEVRITRQSKEFFLLRQAGLSMPARIIALP
jgi:hypothetical protein